ncbi:SGNH/GDSL hydrolase family protein [Janthinobacterium rivuli]|uniref:SGNH/GDSL hydrolase family protein n=1 Tax=Janthinobacterium rivuli TaxID=2751478 RepID=UPI00383AFF5B
MPALTIPDLNNGQLDLRHVQEIATSPADTAKDRLGNVKRTVSGATRALASSVSDVAAAAAVAISKDIPAAIETLKSFSNRGSWLPRTVYAVKDLVSVGATWYVAVVAHVSGNAFSDDVANKWAVYQGLTSADLAAGIVPYTPAGSAAQPTNVRDQLRKGDAVLNFLMGSPATHFIVVAGDSNLAAVNPVSGAGNDIVSQLMQLPKLQGRATVINTAVNGRFLSNLVAGYFSEVEPYKPRGTIFMSQPIIGIGTNDFVYIGTSNPYGVPATVAEWLLTFDAYVAQYIADGFSPPILCTIYRKDNAVGAEAHRVEMNRGIARIAEKYSCKLLDRDGILPDPSDRYWYEDGTHPRKTGNGAVAKRLGDIFLGGDDALGFAGYAESRRLKEAIASVAARSGFMRVPEGLGHGAKLATAGPNIGAGDFACGLFLRLTADQNTLADIFGQQMTGLRLVIFQRKPCIYAGGYKYAADTPSLVVGAWNFVGWLRTAGKLYIVVNDRFYGPIVSTDAWTGIRYFLSDTASSGNNPPADVVAPFFCSQTATWTQMLEYYFSAGMLPRGLTAELWHPYWTKGAVQQAGDVKNELLFASPVDLIGVRSDNLPWIFVDGTSFSIEPYGRYVVSNAALITGTLSEKFPAGATFEILNKSKGGAFRVAQRPGQVIYHVASATTLGSAGYLESATSRVAVKVLCDTENTGFTVTTVTGNIVLN